MQLPDTFLYGATIGAHQAEGGDFGSDWWRWEQRPSRISDGETSERGAGHFERYKADLDIARKLGHNAVCLTVSWPRVHPEADRFDAAALDHYRRVFSHANACGLTPLCVLHSVTQPSWFSARGGWNGQDSVALFAGYVREVVKALDGLCHWWLPIHEPEHWLTLVYRERLWPGAETGRGAYRVAFGQLAAAHCRAATVIHEYAPEAQVGISVRGALVEPMDWHSPWDARAAQYEQQRLNMRFIEAATSGDGATCMDFIGLSFYGKIRVRFAPLYWRGAFALPVDENGAAAGIEVAQENAAGLAELLFHFSLLRKPLLLTGVGVASDDDKARCHFLRDHVEALLHSMHTCNGTLDVRALFYASLLDGFEWRHGYTRRYGLVHVKHPGLERTPNPSAWFFKDIAEHGCIREGALQQFCTDVEGKR